MGFRKYLFTRIRDSIATLLLILVINFFMFFKRMNSISGLAIYEQFTSYLEFLSLRSIDSPQFKSAISLIADKFPKTLLLVGLASFFAISVGMLLGIFTSLNPKSRLDTFITFCLMVPYTIPTWWLSIVFLNAFYERFPIQGWFDVGHWSSFPPKYDPIGFLKDIALHVTLPVICLTLSLSLIYFLITKNTMRNVLSEDYIKTAKAKGFSVTKILFRQALPNALLPITATIGLTFAIIVNETLPVELVYSKSGIGWLLYKSLVSPWGFIRESPLPTFQFIFLAYSAIVVISQLVLDIAHFKWDPRLKNIQDEIVYDERVLLAEQGGWGSNLSGIFGTLFRIILVPIQSLIGFIRSVFMGSVHIIMDPRSLKRAFDKVYRGMLRLTIRRFKKIRKGILGISILSFFIIIAVIAPYLPLANPEKMTTPFKANPPSSGHWLGTDEFGRDILSRLIWSTRVSLFECLGALTISLSIGCLVGILSGYFYGQWYAYILDRLTDMFLAIPLITFIMFFPLPPGSYKWVIVTGLATWGITAKLVRSQVLTIRDKLYVQAAKSAGASTGHILLYHVLPEALPVLSSSIIYTAITVITIQSSLDFFEFRRFVWDPFNVVRIAPVLSWGTLLSYGTIYGGLKYWWTIIPPAICMTLLGYSLILISNTLMEAFNPQLERKRI